MQFNSLNRHLRIRGRSDLHGFKEIPVGLEDYLNVLD